MGELRTELTVIDKGEIMQQGIKMQAKQIQKLRKDIQARMHLMKGLQSFARSKIMACISMLLQRRTSEKI